MISAHDLFDALAALGGDGLGIIHIAERVDGGAHHVDRVGRTDAFRQHVAHAQHFEYRAHRTAGDDTGTLGGRLPEHLGRAVARPAIYLPTAAAAAALPVPCTSPRTCSSTVEAEAITTAPLGAMTCA